MRKLLLAALVAGFAGAAVLASGGAGLASAHSGRTHHHATRTTHHSRSHVRHSGATGTTGPTGSTGATTPTSAGTVQSFSGGVLTIKLSSGTVTGMVTDRTVVIAEMSPASDNDADDQGQGGQDQGGGDDQGHFIGHWFEGHDNGCMAATALTTGAVVIAADLAITPAGSFFTKVILMSCPSTGATGTTGTSGSTGMTGATGMTGDRDEDGR
jgi:hypothetical protein